MAPLSGPGTLLFSGVPANQGGTARPSSLGGGLFYLVKEGCT